MSLAWRDAAAVKRSAGAMYFREADGTDPGDLKPIDQVRLRLVNGTAPGDLSEVYKQGIRLAALPSSAFGASSAKTGAIVTNSVTVNVAGGTAPYSHAWAATAGITVDSPTSANSAFRATPPAIFGEVEGTASDTVTDFNGLTSTIDIPVFVSRG